MVMNNQNTFWAVFRGVMDVVDIPLHKTAPSDTWVLADTVVDTGVFERTRSYSSAVVWATSDPKHPRLDEFLKGLESQ
jgi:hypothetical protein